MAAHLLCDTLGALSPLLFALLLALVLVLHRLPQFVRVILSAFSRLRVLHRLP